MNRERVADKTRNRLFDRRRRQTLKRENSPGCRRYSIVGQFRQAREQQSSSTEVILNDAVGLKSGGRCGYEEEAGEVVVRVKESGKEEGVYRLMFRSPVGESRIDQAEYRVTREDT